MQSRCYMCSQPGNTEEHAPPKCIFPEAKDLPAGVDYRKNLIKVPSCSEHNTARSKDDEYLMYVLPASIGSNETGLNQFLGKVQRAIARRPLLANYLLSEAKSILVHDTEADTWFTATAVPFDMQRVNRVLEMNARALYFHHYGKAYMGKIVVHKNFLLDMERPELNELGERMFNLSNQLFALRPPLGDNPEVFTYRFERSESNELVEMTFYGKNKAVAHLVHETPHNAESEA